MEVITMSYLKEILNGKVEAGTRISGVALVSNYNIALTKTRKEYITGFLMSGIKVPFKAWGNSQAFNKLKIEEYSNTPVLLSGTVDNFNDCVSIVLDDLQAVEGYDLSHFMETKYNADAYYTALRKSLDANLSERGKAVVDIVLTGEIEKEFKVQFAASSVHDNCKSGLLAHTYKCLSLLNWTTNMYKTLMKVPVGEDQVLELSEDRKDLLYLGVLFHDIGKIREMNYGVYQNCSKVTHRFLGVEILDPAKPFILENYGEAWYYDLVSILLQHHGEWGDPCKTLVSTIVHQVDLFESRMTILEQALTDGLINTHNCSKIKYDGTQLSVD